MKISPIAAIACYVALLFASPAARAHHGFSVEFDRNSPIHLTGTVTKVEFMNPHIYFYLDVKGKDGTVVNWAFEGGPPNVLYRHGWRKDTVKPGDNLSPLDIIKFTAAFGGRVLAQNKGRKVVIGRDGRISGEMVSDLVVSTLRGMGLDVIDLGMCDTSFMYFAINRAGSAWEAVGRARNLAVYVPSDLPDARFELVIVLR